MIARPLGLVTVAAIALSLLLPIGMDGDARAFWPGQLTALIPALGALGALIARLRIADDGWADAAFGLAALVIGAAPPLLLIDSGIALGFAAWGLWLYVIGLVLVAWQVMERLARLESSGRTLSLVVPALFGIWVIYLWQVIVIGFSIEPVLLPPPTRVALKLVAQPDVLWGDFRQTFDAVLAGFAIGCAAGFATAVLIDRVPFLQRGLLPLGNLASAVPIVGVAPIMVMWFGFNWESKAAVIVVMIFFPMLINTRAGLVAADHMQRDLMHSYGATYWQTFFKLRLPAALPFVFNALKINSTLALIGGIVAEFFGSPTAGLGFRISVEVGRMSVDVVWATIAVAALAGSLFYGVLALVERGLTFWHPSYRK